MSRTGKQTVIFLILVSFLFTLMAGCTSSQDAGGLPTGEPQVLRVMGGWGDEQYVRNQWTDYYELTHNVEIEIIPMYEPMRGGTDQVQEESLIDRVKRILTEDNPPDVILIEDLSMLTTLVEEGLVQPLDTFMEKSNFDVEGLVPAIREGIKQAGDGNSMYALAQLFSSQALFYNKNLFDEKGIPYPTDNMTWDQIAELALQFNSGEGEERIYGFWSNDGRGIYHFINVFAGPLELSLFSEDFKRVEFDSAKWERALTKYISYLQDGVFPEEPDYTQEWTPEMDLFWRAFYNGQAAMAVLHSYELQNLQQMRNFGDGSVDFDWDVVTVPTHAEAPGVGGNIYMQGLMAINRNAQNADLAWDFIHFNNSEDMLKLKSRQQGVFVTQEAYIQTNMENGPANLQAFYALKPAPNLMFSAYQEGGEKVYEVMATAEHILQEIINGEKSVQEGLAEIKTKGQEIMDRGQ